MSANSNNMEVYKRSYFLKLLLLTMMFIAACSNDVDSNLEQGIAYFEASQFIKAHASFNKSIELDPNKAKPYYYLAKIAESNKNLKRALQLYNKAVSRDPDSINARLGLGLAYMRVNRLDLARAQAAAVSKLDVNNQDARALLATISYKKGDIKQAVKLAEDIVEKSPDNILAVKLLTINYITNGYESKALALLEKVNDAVDGSNAEIFQQLFIIYNQRKDSSGAERILLQQLKHRQDDLTLYRTIIKFYESVDQIDKAVKILNTAIDNDPDNIEKYRLLTDLYLSQHGMRKAIAETRSFVNEKPESISLRMILAELYSDDKQMDFAEEVYQGVVDMTNVSNAEEIATRHKAQLQIAQININKNNLSKAESVIDSVLDESPRMVEALMLRGQIAKQQNNNELMRDTLAKIIQIQPKNKYARLQMSILLSQMGENEAALQAIDELLILDNNLAPALKLRQKILSKNKS